MSPFTYGNIAVCDITGGDWGSGLIDPNLPFVKNNTCPKGWGKNKWYYNTDYYTTGNAQGYINDNSTPVYSSITKYRDAYHNYITTRVAKA